MNEFIVKLADERGRVQEQTHAAATAEELRARFTQAGLPGVFGKAAVDAGAVGEEEGQAGGVSDLQPAVFDADSGGLADFEFAGIAGEAAEGCRASGRSWRMWAARVKTGESISAAFEAQGTFPLVYTTTLLAGERSGNLEEVLQRYLDFQRVALTFRKKLRASLIYPAFLIVMVIGLFIFLITFVVPRFASLYDAVGDEAAGADAVAAGAGAETRSTTGFILRRCWC